MLCPHWEHRRMVTRSLTGLRSASQAGGRIIWVGRAVTEVTEVTEELDSGYDGPCGRAR